MVHYLLGIYLSGVISSIFLAVYIIKNELKIELIGCKMELTYKNYKYLFPKRNSIKNILLKSLGSWFIFIVNIYYLYLKKRRSHHDS